MGVIKRQAIKQSLVSYSSLVISVVAVIWIYPLDTEAYGLARFIIDGSLILSPFILMGLGGLSIRFFPEFRNPSNGNHGFLGFLIILLGISSLALIFIYQIFKQEFVSFYADRDPLFITYLPTLLPMGILTAFILLFVNYSSNFQRIVWPTFFQNLIRITLPILILALAYSKINLRLTTYAIIGTFAMALLLLILYLSFLGQLKLKINWPAFTPARRKAMANYAAFGLFNSIGSMLAFRIDLFMVPTLLDFKSNGVYAISFFIANAIAIPTTAINQISGPIITTALKENNLAEVRMIYQKSSLNLMAVGLLLFVGVVCSIEDLFLIMPKNEELVGGGLVVLLVGAAKVIDMATSVNNQIINYSKYYKFGFVAIGIMAVSNITLNIILIKEYQIVGAAMASLISLGLYNLIKLVFIQWKFSMQPFQTNSLWILFIAGIAFLVGTYLPLALSPILNILIRSGILVVLFAIPVWHFNLAPDIIDLVKGWLKKFRIL